MCGPITANQSRARAHAGRHGSRQAALTTAPVQEVPYLQGERRLGPPTSTPTRTIPPLRPPAHGRSSRCACCRSISPSRTRGWRVRLGGPSGPSCMAVVRVANWERVGPTLPRRLIVGMTQAIRLGAAEGDLVESNGAYAARGYQGRLNGPVDNKVSSCTSCHGTAEFPAGTMVPPQRGRSCALVSQYPVGGIVRSGTAVARLLAPDLAVGLSNFQAAQALKHAPSPAAFRTMASEIRQTDTRAPSRWWPAPLTHDHLGPYRPSILFEGAVLHPT